MSESVGGSSESIPFKERKKDGSPPSYDVTNNNNTTIRDQGQTKTNANGTPFKFSKAPQRKKIVLVLCTFLNFVSSCAISVLAPFYPVEARRKGMDLTTIGFVFSVYQLVVFLTSPIVGKFMTRIGVKFVYLSGVFVGGCCAILFGLLDKGPDGEIFIVMSFLVRCVEAMGFAGFLTASMTIVSNEFPDHVGSVMALQEAGCGLGLMIGPVIAGFLYELGGYGLPFYAVGVLNLLGGVLIYAFLPDIQNGGNNIAGKKSFLPLFCSSMIVFTIVAVVVAIASLNVAMSTLALYLEQFGISEAGVGGMYAIGPLAFIIMTSFAGYITDTKDIQAALIIFGFFLYTVAWFLNGPSPFLPFISASLLSTGFARLFNGMGCGCLIVPTMKCMVKGALELKYEKNADTFALVSGMFNAAYALGGFTGPIVGGVLIDRFGFAQGYTIVGLANLCMCVLAVGFFFFRYVGGHRKGKMYEDAMSDLEKKDTSFKDTAKMDYVNGE